MTALDQGPSRLYGSLASRMADVVDARMVATMRCVLAISALVIIYIVPTEPARLVELTYVALSTYCIYSIALCLVIAVGRAFVQARVYHWIDVIFYVCLVALSEGTSSIFFFFFFFAIIVAAFSYGYKEGLWVTVVSGALFMLVGLATAPTGPDFELSRSLIRPIYLTTLGYMLSYWGGHEIAFKRRLGFLKEIADFANPRLGAEHVIALNLERLREFFRADSCLLVIDTKDTDSAFVYRVDTSGVKYLEGSCEAERNTVAPFLSLPAGAAGVFSRARMISRPLAAKPIRAWDAATGEAITVDPEQFQALANLLESSSLATTPYLQHGKPVGRIFLTSAERKFSRAECEFLGQAAGQISAVVDNVLLLDELSSNAANIERSRISRDIHDTTIQQYIGLKLGLEALARNVEPGSAAAVQVRELVEMTQLTVSELRSYIARLRGERTEDAQKTLVCALREQVEIYRTYFGIDVQIDGDAIGRLDHRLAAEVHQIVSEALSNIRRHTDAQKAFVDLRRTGNIVAVAIGNDVCPDKNGSFEPFLPRSIVERAIALGGSTEVERSESGFTVVSVSIPL